MTVNWIQFRNRDKKPHITDELCQKNKFLKESNTINNEIMNEGNNQVVSVGDWIVTLLVTAIPIIGFIMLFVWAFGDGTEISKKNWARATLILFVVVIVVYVIIFAFLGLAFMSELN